MELQRQEYPSMLTNLSASQAIRILYDRLQHIRLTNTEVAQWLQERRRIEEQYAINLKKLATRPLGQDKADLGIFTTAWEKIVKSTDALASAHASFSRNIENDVEKPLRVFVNASRELASMDNIIGNIEHIAKDIDSAQKKMDKIESRAGKVSADKVASAASELEDAQTQWNSQAPYVFEKLQQVDELRLGLLQKSLTQFQTLTDETKNSPTSSLEECLNALLNVQPADEIMHFSMRAPTTVSVTRQRRLSRLHSSSPAPESNVPALPALPTIPQLDASSEWSSPKDKSTKEKRSSTFGGWKRLGTVIKRQRQSTHPYDQSLQAFEAINEKKRSSASLASKFSSLRKNRDLSNHSPNLQPSGLQQSCHSSQSPVPSLAEVNPRASLHRTLSLNSFARPRSMGAARPCSMSNASHPLDAGLHRLSTDSEPAKPLPVMNHDPAYAAPSHPPTLLSTSRTPEPLEAQEIHEAKHPETDTSSADEQHTRLRGSDAMAQAMSEAAAVSDSSQPQLKLDIKNTPIQEEDGDACATVLSVANALRAATPRRNPTLRGRRDRNTVLIPSSATPDLPCIAIAPSTSLTSLRNNVDSGTSQLQTPSNSQSPVPSPVQLPTRSAILSTDDSAASDAHSVRSGQSLSSTGSNTVRHPDMLDPGLNASIVETISAWFTDGECRRAMEIGEIALVHNPHDSARHFGLETIRFEDYDMLEKVVPNSSFIDQVSGKDGVYSVNLSHISRPSVAFKYQVRLDAERAAAIVPLLILPAWKIDATQTLVMLSFSMNPVFALTLPAHITSITLSNLSINVRMSPENGKIIRCQAQGGGSYSRQRHLLYWRLGDLTLTRDAQAQVLRARFITEAETKPGSVEAKWEIAGDQAASVTSPLRLTHADPPSTEEREETGADPFGDDSAVVSPVVSWSAVKTLRTLRSGIYSTTSEVPS